MCCKSRQEAGNIMMVLVISVACRQSGMKSTLFFCALQVACKCVRWGFNLQTCFTVSHWHTKLLSIRLELFISPKLVLKMSSTFSRNKLMIPIVLFHFISFILFYFVLLFGRYSLETLPYLTYRFISELMDIFLMAGVHQQPEQSNYLAER